MKIASGCYCILIFILIISCNEESHKVKQDEPVAQSPLSPDSNLVKLKRFFQKDSNVIEEEKPQIPFDLIRQFYRGDDTLNEENRSPVTPITWIENKYGYFLIIEIGCGAGGYCSTFDLLAFSKGGWFIGRQFLGQNAGDLGFHEDFFYKTLSDTTLFIESTSYDTPEGNDSDSGEDRKEKLTDSVTYRIMLDTIHYNKENWKKL